MLLLTVLSGYQLMQMSMAMKKNYVNGYDCEKNEEPEEHSCQKTNTANNYQHLPGFHTFEYFQ